MDHIASYCPNVSRIVNRRKFITPVNTGFQPQRQRLMASTNTQSNNIRTVYPSKDATIMMQPMRSPRFQPASFTNPARTHESRILQSGNNQIVDKQST